MVPTNNVNDAYMEFKLNGCFVTLSILFLV